MKDVGNITRVMPDKRVEALMKFRRRLADNPKVSLYLVSSIVVDSILISS